MRKLEVMTVVLAVAVGISVLLVSCVPGVSTDSEMLSQQSADHSDSVEEYEPPTSGQGADGAPEESEPPTSEQLSDDSPEEAASPIVKVETDPPTPITQSLRFKSQEIDQSRFAFNLAAQMLPPDEPGRNVLISPLSAWLSLVALTNATDPRLRPDLLESLGVEEDVPQERLNTYAKLLLHSLSFGRMYGDVRTDASYIQFRMANGIFVDDGSTIEKGFAQTFSDYFAGAAFSVDFQSSEAVGAINKWASDQTDGLIGGVIDSFRKETDCCLLNAAHYADRWQDVFDELATNEGVFHTAIGDATAQFMHGGSFSKSYYEDERIQAAHLPLLGAWLWVLLPKNESANDLYADLTSEYFKQMEVAARDARLSLKLPKFEIASGIDLTPYLESLGVPLFDEESRALTDGLIEGDSKAFLDAIEQKAVIKVDEGGVNAAAVTQGYAYDPEAGSEWTDERFEMICDKPFVFILESDGVVIFTGVVNDPSLPAE